jgi:LysR family transcriptional regulator, nitrogen assimilation regulatory protein
MNLSQLHSFVQVAELGSFSRAALRLRIAQPALSRQVRALEVDLRQTLFERTGRGVTLTPAGQRLLGHARGILQQVQRAQQDMAEQRGAPIGHVCIGLVPSIGRSFTAPLVAKFRQQFPQASLSVVEGLSAALIESLLQGRTDVVLVYDPAPSRALHIQPVVDEPLHLVQPALARPGRRSSATSRAGPISLRELAAQGLVMPARPNAIRMRVEAALAGAGLVPQVALEVDSVPAIIDIVAAGATPGGAAAVLTAHAVHASGRASALRRRAILGTAKQGLSVQLAIATSTQRPGGALLEQTVQALQDWLPQHLNLHGKP